MSDPADPMLELVDLELHDDADLDRRVSDLVHRCIRLVELSVDHLAPQCRAAPSVVARTLEAVARRKAEELEREPS